jgi:hypothetical protein
VNESRFGFRLKLLSELLDVDFEDVRAALDVVPPYAIHEKVLGKNAPRVKQKLPEDLVFR